MWWAISTITTVGYGDVYPITLMGKVLAGIVAICGIGIIAMPAGIISANFNSIHLVTFGAQSHLEFYNANYYHLP